MLPERRIVMPNLAMYPPKPRGRLVPGNLPEYEKSGKWLAQRKFNGTHILISISPDREVDIIRPGGEPTQQFSPTRELLDEIKSLSLESGKQYWLDGELLNNKTATEQYKGKLVLFDVLQAGRYLMGSPKQVERLQMLNAICRNPTQLEPNNGIALVATPNVWLAQSFFSDFVPRYRDFLDHPEIEGLMLRKRESTLDKSGSKKYLVDWMIRCRKPHTGGSYDF
jgi:hypothetical protein